MDNCLPTFGGTLLLRSGNNGMASGMSDLPGHSGLCKVIIYALGCVCPDTQPVLHLWWFKGQHGVQTDNSY